MSKIRIKNFGPIKEGFTETLPDGTVSEWMDVKKVTVFIGNQGSGKSTVAKLISTLTWMEKVLSREDYRTETLLVESFYKHFEYQRIEKYFRADTVIEYDGEFASILVKRELKDCLITTSKKSQLSILPKIMYVPAERNFLTVIKDAYDVTNIPHTLRTFGEELKKCLLSLNGNLLALPIGKDKIMYERYKDKMYLINDDLHLEISDASSGYQSLVPLYAVTKYLAEETEHNRMYPDPSKLTINLLIRRQFEVDASHNDQISLDAATKLIDQKYFTGCLINIVEEPEQNLFPTAQRAVLYSLLEYNNLNDNNKLIMTTHSPYLINFLSISVQGAYLLCEIEKRGNATKLRDRLNNVVPIQSTVSGDDVVVYQLDEESGLISKLATLEGIPSDQNYLNQSLRHGNEMFDALLEIEEEL